MKGNFVHKSPNLSQTTQVQFGQSVIPTVISQSEFNKMFSFNHSIGEGSYGAIKAVLNCYNEIFAIKESKDNQETYGVFREAAIMKKFNHPNILKIIGFYQIKENKKLFILTQFCKFKSLKDYAPNLSSLPEKQKYRLVVEIFNGLQAMHSKFLMHRDLKPQNVLIDQDKHAKLCDFGFCRYDKTQDLSKSRKVGTLLYNSPETDRGIYTRKCDIYSYGLIVYFVFSNGKNLFRKTDTQQELKGQKQQHFKKGVNAYRDSNFSDDIIKLLINTITEKEEKRWDAGSVKDFWKKVLEQKNMKELFQKMQESEMINNYQKKVISQSQNNTLKNHPTLSKGQKLASELIKRDIFSKDQSQASQQMQTFLQKNKHISELMREFKKTVEEVDLSKTQKELVTYGFLYQLELKLQAFLTECNKLSSREKEWNSQSLKQCMRNLFDEIIVQKKKLSTMLVKLGNNLDRVKFFLKPYELLSPISQSFDQIKKLDAYLKEVCSQGGVASFKMIEEIQDINQLYSLIENRYKPQVDSVAFDRDFAIILSKYRNALAKNNKQNQRQRLSTLFDKLKDI